MSETPSIPKSEAALTPKPQTKAKVEHLSGFEAWDREIQTDRHKKLHLLATRLKDELRGTDEEVYQETKDAVPSRTYAAASDLAYALVSLLEDAPSIIEGLGDQEYPDYPHQSAFINTLESAIEVLGLPYEIKRKLPEQDVIEIIPDTTDQRSPLASNASPPDAYKSDSRQANLS
jgi:hypothetical protein